MSDAIRHACHRCRQSADDSALVVVGQQFEHRGPCSPPWPDEYRDAEAVASDWAFGDPDLLRPFRP